MGRADPGARALLMTAITLVIFITTLLAVLTRPRGLSEGAAACVGAVATVAVGAVSVPTALRVLATNWNVFLFFLGMLTLTGLAEQAGVFSRLATAAARLARGSQRRLLLNVFLVGILVSTFLTNDATALVLTPIVYTVVRRLDLDPLPYLFTCTFIADTASLTLPVSNPINLVIGDHFSLNAADFLRLLLLPSAAAIVLNMSIFFILFRDRVRGTFDTTTLPAEPPVASSRFFRYTALVLIMIAVAFVAAGSAGVPAGIIAMAGAALLFPAAWAWQVLDARRFVRDFSWGIFPFVGGLFVMVRGVERAGLTAPVGHALHAAGGDVLLTALLSTGVGALGTNLINNVPMALVLISAIGRAHGHVGHALVYGSILGCDLGPNLTTTGSLSTMLWLLLLRQRGLEVSSLHYARYGLLVTPLTLVVTSVLLGLIA